MSLQDHFGQIDIYVFDQILRGNLHPGQRILDAGCGYGRNLVYLLRAGAEIFAADASSEAIDHVRQLAHQLSSTLPPENFQVAQLEALPFPDAFVDAVLCNSVLHFAHDEAHFRAMLAELWRCLRPGGLLFTRIGSRIGMDFPALGRGLYQIGDGSAWFLVDEQMLLSLTRELNAILQDPIKTTIVQDYRCMTTWVLRKPIAGLLAPRP